MEPIWLTILVTVPIIVIGTWAYLRRSLLKNSCIVSRWIAPYGKEVTSGLSTTCMILLAIELLLIGSSGHHLDHAPLALRTSLQITIYTLVGTSLALLVSSVVVSLLEHKAKTRGFIVAVVGLFAALVLPTLLPQCKF